MGLFGKKATKSEAIPGSEGWVEEWDRPENKGVPFYVAYEAADNKLVPRPRIAVPAARTCPKAEMSAPDGSGQPLCDFQGWRYRFSKTAPPGSYCPGTRYDGKPCEEKLVLKATREIVEGKDYTIKCDQTWLPAFCEERGFPKIDDPADAYAVAKGQDEPEHPFRGLSWRQALNLHILPKQRAPGRRKPGEPGYSPVGQQRVSNRSAYRVKDVDWKEPKQTNG